MLYLCSTDILKEAHEVCDIREHDIPNGIIDIRATRIEHSVIAADILAIQAISGADTVSSYLGIG